MGISFGNPWILLLAVPSCVFILWGYVKNSRIKRTGEKYSLVLRFIIVLLLILSLAGFSIKKYSDKTTLIFAVDLSNSTREVRGSMADFMRRSMENKPAKYQTGIITFGKDTFVEQPLSFDMIFHGLETIPDPNYTDIGSGLQMASALMPDDTQKRVLLLTDGNENMGEAIQRAKSLSHQGIRIDGVFFDTEPGAEVQISSLDVPTKLYEGEAYDITITIDSTINTDGNIRLYANRSLVGEQGIEILKGENRFIFKDTALEGGIKTYEAELDVKRDSIKQNNRIVTYTEVQGIPILALVEGQEGDGRELAGILESAGMNYKIYDPSSLPKELEELRKFQGTILCNVSADDLGEEKINILDVYAKSLGRGILFTGGDNSYALGGYMDTQLAEMLPVDLDLNHKAEVPDLGLVLVIDKSGSMADGQYGISKMDMAKEAAIRSTESLRTMDYVGVVAFDSEALWVVNTQHPEDLDGIHEKILSIPAMGGTNIYPGLSLAYESLRGLNTKLKHVILMTDGQSMPGDYDGMLDKMKKEGITLSAVAVGQDADQFLLEELAKSGGGRYYFTDEFADIPKIFTKETRMASQSYIQNRTFFPTITEHSPIISGFKEGFPPLDGYITTLSKNTATMALSSDTMDPILAEWQYGLGRVVAWTSDIRGAWTKNWLSWDQTEEFWLGVISRILPFGDDSQGFIETSLHGNQGQISVKLDHNMKEDLDGEAIIIGPKGKETIVPLEVTRPGKYEGNFGITMPGVYIVNTRHSKGGKIVNTLEAGLAVNYSPEYDLRQSGSIDFLKEIVAQTGGRIIDNPEEIFREDPEPVWTQTGIWPWLLPIALLLFVLDIAMRRLNIADLIGKHFKLAGDKAAKDQGHGGRIVRGENQKARGQRATEPGIEKERRSPKTAGKNVHEGTSKDPEDEAPGFTTQLLKARKGDKRKRL